MCYFNRIFIGLVVLFQIACATPKFLVKSEPAQADVSIINEKGEKKPLGKTPLEMPLEDVKKQMSENSTGQFFSVIVEKQGFESQTMSVPTAKFATLVTELDVKLKEGQDKKEIRAAQEILDHLFLAQKFALTNQFERAHIELDKILTPFPTFSKALSMRASVYFVQKNYQESLKWFEEALKSDPQMDEAVKMTAKVRTILGMPQVPGSNDRLPAAVGKDSPAGKK